MLERTLWGMASGGMYDQIGGGFARYSVDVQWLVPHFEKMLYDNAQLARVYLHAFQLFGDAEHERIVRETLTYLEREMLGEEGGFYSAQDADSEGIEGKFFLWTVEQVADLLGDDAEAFNPDLRRHPRGQLLRSAQPRAHRTQRSLPPYRSLPRRQRPRRRRLRPAHRRLAPHALRRALEAHPARDRRQGADLVERARARRLRRSRPCLR